MAGQLKKISGPAHLANAAANIYTPEAATIYTVIRHIRVTNKTGTGATFRLFIGASGGSAAGTEIAFDKNVPPNDWLDFYFAPGLKLLSTEFLTGFASAASTLTIVVMGELYVV